MTKKWEIQSLEMEDLKEGELRNKETLKRLKWSELLETEKGG